MAGDTGALMQADASMSYEAWGREFFTAAVTEERLLGAVNALAGQPIDFGPIGVGPGKVAKVQARGAIGEAVAQPVPGELIRYRVLLPVEISFRLDLQVDRHRFDASLQIPLVLTARAMPGLKIWIEITPPEPAQVQCDLRAAGLRASLVKKLADVEGELKRFVARYVTREIDKPAVQGARVIDVQASIDKAWTSIAPQPVAEGATMDLNEQLEQEIQERSEVLLPEE